MTSRRFVIDVDIFENFRDNSPGGFFLGWRDDAGSYQVRSEDVENLKKKFAVDTISSSLYGKPIYDFLAPYEKFSYKVYDFLPATHLVEDKCAFPYDIDFKTMLTSKLSKKSLPKVQGKPTLIEYYESYDTATGVYTNLIAKIDFTLHYDPLGFIYKIEKILRFKKTDESWSSEFKDIGRSYDMLYDAEFRIKEGKLRRESIVDNLQLPILAVLRAFYPMNDFITVVKMGRDFLDNYEREFDLFIKASKKDIITAIQAETESPWLEAPIAPGLTVRQHLINELSVSG